MTRETPCWSRNRRDVIEEFGGFGSARRIEIDRDDAVIRCSLCHEFIYLV